jgi:serine protease Do
MTDVIELRDAVRTAATALGGSVVAVGRGAGVVVSAGRVLTNAHNVAAGEVPVRFADGRTAGGEVAAADIDGDLAVVGVDTGEASPATFADAPPGLGEPVLAFGAPRRGPARITVGFVCAVDQAFRGPRGRRLVGVEHTAPVGRGSSGGPIVDLDGRVVGIDTHRRGDGLYLALPAGPELADRVARLARGEAPSPPRLGIAIAPPQVARRLRAAVGLEERDGLLVRDVDPDGPASRAGMRQGDLVVAVDGAPVASPDDLLDHLADSDGPLTLTVVRGVDEIDVRVDPDTATREEGSA